MPEWWERSLDLVFPPRCAGCGAPGHLLCPACRAAVASMPPPVCPSCGRSNHAPAICAACRTHPPETDSVIAAALFAHPVRECIHALKYEGQRRHAALLAELSHAAFARVPPCDAVVPVPLHLARERARGFNQAALIARHLARPAGLPVMHQWLRRTRDTPQQVGQDRAARQANVHGAFACPDPAAVRGAHLLLMDDVATTGATLDTCALALRAAGAASVHAFVVARLR